MDWFTALEPPTQVAIVGVFAGLVAAAGAVAVAIINNRRSGGGKAEIAAMTMDASSIRQVSAALEAFNVTAVETNKVGQDLIDSLDGAAKALDKVREELRITREINRR